MSGIRLSSHRCEEIKKIVVNMFVTYNVNCVPINSFEIAAKMGKSEGGIIYKIKKCNIDVAKERAYNKE